MMFFSDFPSRKAYGCDFYFSGFGWQCARHGFCAHGHAHCPYWLAWFLASSDDKAIDFRWTAIDRCALVSAAAVGMARLTTTLAPCMMLLASFLVTKRATLIFYILSGVRCLACRVAEVSGCRERWKRGSTGVIDPTCCALLSSCWLCLR